MTLLVREAPRSPAKLDPLAGVEFVGSTRVALVTARDGAWEVTLRSSDSTIDLVRTFERWDEAVLAAARWVQGRW